MTPVGIILGLFVEPCTVEYMRHRIGVMYLGRRVEVSKAEGVTARPLHPYTATLVAIKSPFVSDRNTGFSSLEKA